MGTEQTSKDFLVSKVADHRMSLGAQTTNALLSRSVNYIWQLVELSEKQLKTFRRIDVVGVERIKVFLLDNRYSLNTIFGDEFKERLVEGTGGQSIKDVMDVVEKEKNKD
jgi:hypothetical protein